MAARRGAQPHRCHDHRQDPAINSGRSGSGGFGGGGGGGGGFSGSLPGLQVQLVHRQRVDLNQGALGPLSSGRLNSGRTFAAADASANVALVNADYATQNKLKVGSTVTVAKTSFKVVGIVSARPGPIPPTSTSRWPAPRPWPPQGQRQHHLRRRRSATTSARSEEISAAVPSATVTNSSSLASQLTGSISSTSSLANNLGKWLAIAVLVAAFLLASLLTMAAVARRVREFGTLKALGWRSRRIIGQVMGEALVIGIIGGIVGVGLGFLGRPGRPPVQAADRLARPDHRDSHPGRGADVRRRGGGFGGGGGGGFGGGAAGGGGGGFFGRADPAAPTPSPCT